MIKTLFRSGTGGPSKLVLLRWGSVLSRRQSLAWETTGVAYMLSSQGDDTSPR